MESSDSEQLDALDEGLLLFGQKDETLVDLRELLVVKLSCLRLQVLKEFSRDLSMPDKSTDPQELDQCFCLRLVRECLS